jgi:hypothetical protein
MATMIRRGFGRLTMSSVRHRAVLFSSSSSPSDDVTFEVDPFVVSAPMKAFSLKQGIRLAQRFATARFDESIDVSCEGIVVKAVLFI